MSVIYFLKRCETSNQPLFLLPYRQYYHHVPWDCGIRQIDTLMRLNKQSLTLEIRIDFNTICKDSLDLVWILFILVPMSSHSFKTSNIYIYIYIYINHYIYSAKKFSLYFGIWYYNHPLYKHNIFTVSHRIARLLRTLTQNLILKSRIDHTIIRIHSLSCKYRPF